MYDKLPESSFFATCESRVLDFDPVKFFSLSKFPKQGDASPLDLVRRPDDFYVRCTTRCTLLSFCGYAAYGRCESTITSRRTKRNKTRAEVLITIVGKPYLTI